MSLEQPINAFSWEDPMAQAFISDISADLVAVSACAYGKDYYKRGLFCTSCRALQALASECVHGPDAHEQCAGVRDHDGQYVTRHAAEYPQQLCGKFAEQISKKSSGDDGGEVTMVQALQRMPCKGAFEGPWGSQHGGGVYSVPDWSATNVPRQVIWVDLLADWEVVLEQWHIVPRLQQHVVSPSDDPVFTDDEVAQLRDITGRWLCKHEGGTMQIDWSIPVNQPYALHAMQALSCTVQNRDKNLFPCFLAGVPTGCTAEIPPSSCFIPTPVDEDNEEDSWVLCMTTGRAREMILIG